MINKVKLYQCDLCISNTLDDNKHINRWVVLTNGKVVCPACTETIYTRRCKRGVDVDQGVCSNHADAKSTTKGSEL